MESGRFSDINQLIIKIIIPRDENIEYPIYTVGKRAYPPEGVVGIWGYEKFLKVIGDPYHEEMIEWVGGAFDSEYFDKDEISFDDPDERWKIAFNW